MDYVFIAKRDSVATIPKCYKEQYRLARIPAKIRPILFQNGIIDSQLLAFVQNLDIAKDK